MGEKEGPPQPTVKCTGFWACHAKTPPCSKLEERQENFGCPISPHLPLFENLGCQLCLESELEGKLPVLLFWCSAPPSSAPWAIILWQPWQHFSQTLQISNPRII